MILVAILVPELRFAPRAMLEHIPQPCGLPHHHDALLVVAEHFLRREQALVQAVMPAPGPVLALRYVIHAMPERGRQSAPQDAIYVMLARGLLLLQPLAFLVMLVPTRQQWEQSMFPLVLIVVSEHFLLLHLHHVLVVTLELSRTS